MPIVVAMTLIDKTAEAMTEEKTTGPTRQQRYRGSLLGLAAGDALGTTLEFETPGSFEPVTDIVGRGPFDLKPGQWTDDTAMAMCLAASLVETAGFDTKDQMQRYVRWYRDGYWSSTGACFDIGNTVGAALRRFEATGDPIAGSREPRHGGNGSLMRLAPVPLAFANTPEKAIRLAGEMSTTTHGAAEPVDACRYYAGLIVGALHGHPKSELLSARFSPVAGAWRHEPLAARIDAIAAGSFKEKGPPDIRGTGYVVDALEAALWAFWTSESFREGALAAVNLGDDADTSGAIYGQLAGAYYGVEGIPEQWLEKIALNSDIQKLADELLDLREHSSRAPASSPGHRSSETHPLRIDSLSTPATGLIGLTFCPGKVDPNAMTGPWSRCLKTDLGAIVNWGAGALVTLMRTHELEQLRVPTLGEAARSLGLSWFHLPITDVGVPGPEFDEAWRVVGPELRQRLQNGERVVIHCRGGLGRTGLVAAQLLIEMGEAPETALRHVRLARPHTVETAEQERYVLSRVPGRKNADIDYVQAPGLRH